MPTLAAERGCFTQGWLRPSPALKAGVRGEAASCAELRNAGSNSASVTPGELFEPSGGFMYFLVRMLLVQVPRCWSGGRLVPPHGHLVPPFSQERDLPGCTGHRTKNKLSIQGRIIFFTF